MGTRVRVTIENGWEAAARSAIVAKLRTRGPAVGVALLAQTRRRFRDGGDEEIRWKPLWASTVDPSSYATEQSQDILDAREERAEKAVERLDNRYAKGKIDQEAYELKSFRALKKLARVSEEADRGAAYSYRRGGAPLRDTGALMASLKSVTQETPNGVKVTIGTPLVYAKYQQEGTSKRKGLSFIPLTIAARRSGWTPRLISGIDYIMLRNVSTPARPFVRLTKGNIEEVVKLLGRR